MAISSTQLQVVVPTGSTYQYISVTNVGTRQTAYSSLPFVLIYPTLPVGSLNEFAQGVTYSTGNRPLGYVVKDFNGDGKPDIIVTNTTTVSIMMNITPISSTSFSFNTTTMNVGSNITNAAAEDMDGDGKADLIVSDYNTAIYVYKNTSTTSTISFGTLTTLSATANLWSVAIGDIDLDGKPDLVASGQTSSNVSVFRNTSVSGAISFGPKQDFVGNGSANYVVAFGDMDGDGKADLVTSNNGVNNVSVFRNLSTGPGIINFAPQVSFANGGGAYSVALADFNGDGKLDVASTGSSNGASILLNKAISGTIDANSFWSTVFFSGLSNTYGLSAGDVTGDGKPDIVLFTNNTSYTVSVFRNMTESGAGVPVFGSRTDYVAQSGAAPGRVGLVDLNSDGMLDILTASGGNGNNISILRNIVVAPINILSVSPLSGTIGTSVTITGQNFNPTANQNVVFFGATSATVVSASANVLTVSVPYGATYQYLSVTNLAYNTTGYSTTPFVVTFPSNGITDFAYDGTVSSTGVHPRGTAIGDFNGDGKPDMVITNDTNSNVTVYRNTSVALGSLSFVVGTTLTLPGTSAEAVSIADFDGDGLLDFAVTGYSTYGVQVFRNTTVLGSNNLSFVSGPVLGTAGYSFGIAAGDLDGDGRPDIVSGNIDGGTVNVICVFRNLSVSGTLSFATRQDIVAGTQPINVAIGDLDKDGKPDVVAMNRNSGTVSVFHNASITGTISFTAGPTLTGLSTPFGVAIGDFDQDGNPDIAVANRGVDTISFFLNTNSMTGTISFPTTASLIIPTGTGANPSFGIRAGDVDGDGKVDLFVANASANNMLVLKNVSTGDGSLSFTNRVTYNTAGNYVENGAIGDLNGDGKLDIVVTNYNNANVVNGANIALFRNLATNSPPVITVVTPISGTINSTTIITGQNFSTTPSNNVVFFGATLATVTEGSSTTLSVTVPSGASYQYISVTNLDTKLMAYSPLPFMVNYPTPVGGFDDFVFAINIPVGGSTRPWAHVAKDFNGDGKPDIVVTSDTGNATLLINNTPVNGTSFTFTTQALSVSDANVTNIASDDFDGDGRPDLVIGDYNNKRILIYRNVSSTTNTVTFSSMPILLPATASLWSIAIGDIDLDGRPDIVVVGTVSTNVSVFRNTSTRPGSITFDPKIDFVGNGSTNYTVALGDMDGDGKLDIVTSTDNASNVTVFHNTSTGPGSITFDPQISFVNGGGAYSLALGDLNGDGRLDIVSTGSSNGAYVLLNRGGARTINFASFYSPINFTGQANSLGISMGDVDGDSKPDVVLFSNNTNAISVFKNTTPAGALTVTFGFRVDYSAQVSNPLATNPARISLADLNGDGRLDIIAVNSNANSISILRNFQLVPVIISSFSPTSGPISTTVTIIGQNFNPIPSQNVVFFGATQATVTSASSVTLTVVVPYGANYQYISVTNLDYNTTAIPPYLLSLPTAP